MKSRNVYYQARLKSYFLSLVLVFLSTSCSKDEDDEMENLSFNELTTSQGNLIQMEGDWDSGCVVFDENPNLREVFSFGDQSLNISIDFFVNNQCDGAPTAEEEISITYTSPGTTAARINGNEVIGNKINGTAIYSDGRRESFRQVFYIDDVNTNAPILYHATFESDGGDVNSEGYPIEIIPIGIFRVK